MFETTPRSLYIDSFKCGFSFGALQERIRSIRIRFTYALLTEHKRYRVEPIKMLTKTAAPFVSILVGWLVGPDDGGSKQL
jgi:hypothetical protein